MHKNICTILTIMWYRIVYMKLSHEIFWTRNIRDLPKHHRCVQCMNLWGMDTEDDLLLHKISLILTMYVQHAGAMMLSHHINIMCNMQWVTCRLQVVHFVNYKGL